MYLDALLQVSDVDPFCLEELRHDVPENTHTHLRVGQTCAAALAALALALTLSCGQIASSRR